MNRLDPITARCDGRLADPDTRSPLQVADSDPLDHLCLFVLVRPIDAGWEVVGSFASAGDADAVARRWALNGSYEVAVVDGAERTVRTWDAGGFVPA